MRSIDVGYAARVSLDKAQKGYKDFKAQKAFRLPDDRCLADAPPKAFKHYLPFVLVTFFALFCLFAFLGLLLSLTPLHILK